MGERLCSGAITQYKQSVGHGTIRIEIAIGALLASIALLLVSLMGGHEPAADRARAPGSAAGRPSPSARAGSGRGSSAGSSAMAPLPRGAALPMHVYMMSRCPFGARLLRALAAANEWLDGRLAVSIDFIVGQHAAQPLVVGGADELAADVLLLCASTGAEQGRWLSFAACLSDKPERAPSDFAHCAAHAKLDAKRLSRCASTRGPQLLAKSALRARAADATRSPTLFIDGRRHDGPRATFDLVREACGRLESPLPLICWAELEGRREPAR